MISLLKIYVLDKQKQRYCICSSNRLLTSKSRQYRYCYWLKKDKISKSKISCADTINHNGRFLTRRVWLNETPSNHRRKQPPMPQKQAWASGFYLRNNMSYILCFLLTGPQEGWQRHNKKYHKNNVNLWYILHFNLTSNASKKPT